MALTKEETIKCFKIMLSLIDKGMFTWSELKGVHETVEALNTNLKNDTYELEVAPVNFMLNSVKVCSNRKPVDIDEQIELDLNGMYATLKKLKSELDTSSETTSVTEL